MDRPVPPTTPLSSVREPKPLIEISNLTKRFQDFVAVDQLSLTAESGTIYGLLGPNGAGKSTTISCVSGLLPPTSGTIRIQGYDIVTDAKRAKATRISRPGKTSAFGRASMACAALPCARERMKSCRRSGYSTAARSP